jgi:hypothetical protein
MIGIGYMLCIELGYFEFPIGKNIIYPEHFGKIWDS